MNTIENIKATGRLLIEIIDSGGIVKETREVDNLVVSAGLAFIASRINGTSAAVMSHMAIGSGSTAAVAGNTALGTQLARVALTSTTVSTNTVTYAATFGAGVGTGAVTEAGIFNDASAGTMLCRTVFGVVTKEAGDTMAISWVVTFGAA